MVRIAHRAVANPIPALPPVITAIFMECRKQLLAVHDAMDILSGRWKISIIASLVTTTKDDSEILADVDLEMN